MGGEGDNGIQTSPSIRGEAAPLTSYIVLRRAGDRPPSVMTWVCIGVVNAASDTGAIRAAIEREGIEEEHKTGTFVAVAERFWRPKTREVKTVEQESWS
jgi:hypothetical protein